MPNEKRIRELRSKVKLLGRKSLTSDERAEAIELGLIK